MDTTRHSINTLFEQLGLPSDEKSIDAFIREHQPLRQDLELVQADWWSESQRYFLKESLSSDADWAIIVDNLNARLRQS